MKILTMIALIILTLAFWYGVYASIGMWMFVFMLLSGLTVIGIFYKLSKIKN